jgi:hypothetical protein
MGLRHLSWMISTVHDESRTIPPRRRCARPTSRFTAAKIRTSRCCGTPGAAPRGWRIWRRRSRHPRSSRPTRNSTKLGRIRYDTCCGRSRFTNSSKRAGNASGKSKTDLARRMHSNGEPTSTIAAALGVSRATIYRVLTVDAEMADHGASGLLSFARTAERPLVTRAQPSRSLP